MTRPGTVILFVNIAHALDHLFMLIFATAVLAMPAEFGMDYAELLPLALGGFVAFGALSWPAGWLGDVWSRRNMLGLFFLGGGIATTATGFARTPLELAAGLTAIGAFAAIYHPVGTAMLVAAADRVGRELGINGVWGNMGVALAALVTGALVAQFGWRAAFFVPGLFSVAAGSAFLILVRGDFRRAKSGGAAARVDRSVMRRVFALLLIVAFSMGLAFNAVTVALPKLIEERVAFLAERPELIGLAGFAIYSCGAASQYLVGRLVDRYPLRALFLPVGFALPLALALTALAGGPALLLAAVFLVVALYSQVTINDAMTAHYTADEWRARAFAARYTLSFGVGAGAIALLAGLHALGGTQLALLVLAVMAVPVAAAALAFPRDRAA